MIVELRLFFMHNLGRAGSDRREVAGLLSGDTLDRDTALRAEPGSERRAWPLSPKAGAALPGKRS